MTNIDKVSRTYGKISLWLISGLTLAGLLITQALMRSNFIIPLVINSVFYLVINIFYGKAWKAIASSSPNSLGKFYMAGSMAKMFITLAAVIIGAIVWRNNKEMLVAFVSVFVAFYLANLILDSVYFFKVEKNNKINK